MIPGGITLSTSSLSLLSVQLLSPASFSMDSPEKSIPSLSQLEFAESCDADELLMSYPLSKHGIISHSHTPGTRPWIPEIPSLGTCSRSAFPGPAPDPVLGQFPGVFPPALHIQPSSQGRIGNPVGIPILTPRATSPQIPLAPEGFPEGTPFPFPAGMRHRAHGSKPVGSWKTGSSLANAALLT